MVAHRKPNPDKFLFRDLHPNVLVGMASDRYAGWMGQIYSPEKYTGRILERKHIVGGKPFTEKVLPVESVQEYFDHFPILEIDYTFYRLLLDEKGSPTQNYRVLSEYKHNLKEGDSVILKVPQVIFARKLRRSGKLVENETYLNPKVFINQFYEPAIRILGSHIRGFVFEQEYHLKKDRIEVVELARTLDTFFQGIPKDTRYHVELRTEAYLAESVFEVLEKHSVGLVFSQWTWLPSLREQFTKAGEKFFNSGGECIVRLITPFRMRYEDSYEKAFPFDKMVEGMMNPQMVEDTVQLMREAIKREKKIAIIINNRAGGNGPLIASSIVQYFQGADAHALDARMGATQT